MNYSFLTGDNRKLTIYDTLERYIGCNVAHCHCHGVQRWSCIFNTCTYFVFVGSVLSVSACVCMSLTCMQYVGRCKWNQGSHPMIMLHNTFTSADPISLLSSPFQSTYYVWDSFTTYTLYWCWNRRIFGIGWLLQIPGLSSMATFFFLFFLHPVAQFLKFSLSIVSAIKWKYVVCLCPPEQHIEAFSDLTVFAFVFSLYVCAFQTCSKSLLKINLFYEVTTLWLRFV